LLCDFRPVNLFLILSISISFQYFFVISSFCLTFSILSLFWKRKIRCMGSPCYLSVCLSIPPTFPSPCCTFPYHKKVGDYFFPELPVVIFVLRPTFYLFLFSFPYLYFVLVLLFQSLSVHISNTMALAESHLPSVMYAIHNYVLCGLTWLTTFGHTKSGIFILILLIIITIVFKYRFFCFGTNTSYLSGTPQIILRLPEIWGSHGVSMKRLNCWDVNRTFR
jgi:hypothetical protein